MATFRFLSVGILALISAIPGIAQVRSGISPEDKKQIDATLSEFGSSLARMDFKTFGTLFTDNCDFVNVVGMHWVGKAQVVAAHSVVFTTRYRNVQQHIVEQSEAQLAPGVALVISKIVLDDYTAQDGKRMTDNEFRMTWVMVKRSGRWLIRSAENTPIDVSAAKHDPGVK